MSLTDHHHIPHDSHILIVDDDSTHVMAIEGALAGEYKISKAYHGYDALKQIGTSSSSTSAICTKPFHELRF